MFLEKDSKRIRPPVIRLDEGEEPVIIGDSLKYLGVIFDKKLNFAEHTKATRAKVNEVGNKLIQVTRRTYGRRGKYVRMIVDSVVKPVVWGES